MQLAIIGEAPEQPIHSDRGSLAIAQWQKENVTVKAADGQVILADRQILLAVAGKNGVLLNKELRRKQMKRVISIILSIVISLSVVFTFCSCDSKSNKDNASNVASQADDKATKENTNINSAASNSTAKSRQEYIKTYSAYAE